MRTAYPVWLTISAHHRKMIVADFRIDEDELRRAKESVQKSIERHGLERMIYRLPLLRKRTKRIDVGDLRQIWIRMPVVVQIDDVKLIDGYYIPIFYVAESLNVIRQLPRTRKAAIMFPYGGALYLEMKGKDVAARSHRSPIVHVLYDDLESTWAALAAKIREFLRAEFPELTRDDSVRRWIEGEV